ncbi:MAG: hypothetical protein K8F91_05025 [Candidatus Obscuribacterales bacterium]|nr:hypothetical protein [Candidatus Obscuribacterales bacterium]
MANTTEKTADTLRDERTGKVLDLATGEAKSVHNNAPAKAVTATASLSVLETEGDTTVNDGTEASVTLKTTHSTTKSDAKAS